MMKKIDDDLGFEYEVLSTEEYKEKALKYLASQVEIYEPDLSDERKEEIIQELLNGEDAIDLQFLIGDF